MKPRNIKNISLSIWNINYHYVIVLFSNKIYAMDAFSNWFANQPDQSSTTTGVAPVTSVLIMTCDVSAMQRFAWLGGLLAPLANWHMALHAMLKSQIHCIVIMSAISKAIYQLCSADMTRDPGKCDYHCNIIHECVWWNENPITKIHQPAMIRAYIWKDRPKI